MPTNRWRFISRKSLDQVIVVDDQRSARLLSDLLGRFAPEDWILQEEVILGNGTKGFASDETPNEIPTKASKESATKQVLVRERTKTKSAAERSLPELDLSYSPTREEKTLFTGSASARTRIQASPPPFLPDAPPKGKKQGKRRHKRFELDFKVILICDGKTFRSFSNNVSVGGMALKHKIPGFMLNRKCSVIISRGDSLENIEFHCRILGGPNDAKRLEFVECDSRTVSSLKTWIEKAVGEAGLSGRKTARKAA